MENSTDDPIEIISSFELDQLVYQTVSFLNVPVGALELDNSAIAASYALRKVQHYCEAVRRIENRRRDLGLRIGPELEAAEALRPDDPAEADRLRQAALWQMGEYEIKQHFFTICASQIWRLLALAHRIVGVDLPAESVEVLESYQPLRNQFEHLDERLPSQERGGRLVLDVPNRMMLGLNDDGTGRITVRRNGVDVVAEVNEHGVEELERVVGQSFEIIRAKCIKHLEQFFTDHPELTTDVSWIRPVVWQRLLDDGTYV
jgi:hypothetical protein